MSAADAWLRRRGRRRATFDPSKPVEPTDTPPSRRLGRLDAFWDTVATGARDWDGRDPIRSF